MAIRRISILQLGDVHYAELLAAQGLADHKDKGISESTVAAITSTRLAEIMRRVNQIRREDSELVAILLCGDLTTKGMLSNYSACVSFLSKAFELKDSDAWKDRQFIAVPGNHDIDRGGVSPGQDPALKFEKLVDEWQRICGTGKILHSPL